MLKHKVIKSLLVPHDSKIRLKDYDAGWAQTKELKELGKGIVKEQAQELLSRNRKELADAQELLYASDSYSVLLIFQAMDAAGKDGSIKHVMSGINPQGCQVFSFKQPTSEELDHNFLWRCMKALPERGRIGIFNRSYYEEVLVVKVHPEFLINQRLPNANPTKAFWRQRYEDINNLEKHLTQNGTVIIKFFLNVSKNEQRDRFLDRLNRPEKNWKFSMSDVAERKYWDEYMKAYEDMLNATSTKWAPWYVIPADHKWISRSLIASIITDTIQDLKLKFPELTDEQREAIEIGKKLLQEETAALWNGKSKGPLEE